MIIFVTGATGFLGNALITELLKQGYQVRIFARPTSDIRPFADLANVEITLGDIRERATIEKAMADCHVAIHAAALFRFWGRDEAFNSTNIQGTENILQAAVNCSLQRVILISSIAVIGKPPIGYPITEATPSTPVDAYQKSKLEAEQIALGYHQDYGLEVVILRLGALYGPGGRYAFNRLFFEEFLRGWRIQVARGRHITFPCFVEDGARGITSAVQRGQSGEIYNICGESLTHKQLYRIISDSAAKSSWRLNMPQWLMISTARMLEVVALITHKEPFYPLNLRAYVFQDWVVDSSKAQKALAFQATPIEEGVRQTLAWYESLGIG